MKIKDCWAVSEKDRRRLRAVARWQADIAGSDAMKKIVEAWKANNNFRSVRPMVKIETQTFADDVLPQRMLCEGEFARGLEKYMLMDIVNHTVFHDDTVVKSYFPVVMGAVLKPFDLDIHIQNASGGGIGHHFEEKIHNLQEDFHLFKKSTWQFSAVPQTYLDTLNDLFGDILLVKKVGWSLYCVLTQDIVHLMSMETMLFSMCDYPELFKEMMDRLSDDYVEMVKEYQAQGLLLPVNAEQTVAQGTYAYHDGLPDEPKSLMDIWCFMDSQETVGISPEMFEEFIFPYYRKFSECFGALSYGCCESVHPFFDSCLSKMKNLRKISISPWCDEEMMAERLKDRRIIYHRKPTPNMIGVGTTLDENFVRTYFEKTVRLNRGRSLEFTQRDVLTVNCDEQKVARYVELIREACDRYW